MSAIGILTFTTYALAGRHARAGLHLHVPLAAHPGRHARRAFAAGHLPRATAASRAEPHKKGESWEGRGDCIDCNQCVVVCPTGIDIRDGAQLECINCGLCIDACDEVMDKVGRPDGPDRLRHRRRGAGRARPAGSRDLQLLRPRTLYYGGALVLVGGVMLDGLLTRPTVALDVLRDRNPDLRAPVRRRRSATATP